jgi:alpha-1,3-glucosyltransferase
MALPLTSSLVGSPRSTVFALVFATCVKILLIPAYRSTDFDVHRNWLALTRHLPLSEWYFDDVNGTTVHTLDYPPSFAYFEYMLSSNPVTDWLLNFGLVDERCLALLPDTDNAPSQDCVVFQRSTVIVSGVILWMGAYFASWAVFPNDVIKCRWTFLLIVLNPGLLWLDHVHFQYNGMLLGMLLTSLGLLVKGAAVKGTQHHACILLAAALFAVLLTMKHLYLGLAPLYFVYLLSVYCMTPSFSMPNFLCLAVVTGSSLVAPFVPFGIQKNPTNQLSQLLSRLFPFGRGLVHDYWAGNVWAIWVLSDKVLGFVGRGIGEFWSLPDIPPSLVALILLVGLVPGLVCGWNASPNMLLYCIAFCAMSSFMLAYHVHEKAIMTAIVPLTLLAPTSVENGRLYIRMTAIGVLGLFPLLFRPVELPLKVASYMGFLALAVKALEEMLGTTSLLTNLDFTGIIVLTCVVIFLEIIHPLALFPRMEFLPLLITSTICAFGLFGCWIQTGRLMFRSSGLHSEKAKMK